MSKEIIKENLKIIETEVFVESLGKKFKNYILKKQCKNGVWRKIKVGNLGNNTLEQQLDYELKGRC